MEYLPLSLRSYVNKVLVVPLFGAVILMYPSDSRPVQDKVQQTTVEEKGKPSEGRWRMNLKMKTRGGQQFWTDLRHASGWRIQRNELTGHHRLIDSEEFRIQSGSYDDCNERLDSAIENGDARLHEGEIVIVLHGLVRSRRAMDKLARYLETTGEYEVINFEYASTRKMVGVHAAALKQVIDNLGKNVTRIHFVGHSLGSIVVRHYLGDTTDQETGIQGDSRIGRIVMIGPPNQGSKMAQLLKNSFLFTAVAGASGVQLSRAWDQLEPRLATPTSEFGIIAGAQSDDQKLTNFVLKGKNDFTISVDETKLVGARDFLARPLIHSTMMNQPIVLRATNQFLKNGYFISQSQRQPIKQLQED